jgi:iron-sulfur cluster assembly accessory protein
MSEVKPVIQISQAAWEHIAKLIEQSGGAEKKYFYLTIYETGCTGFMYAPSLIETPVDDDIAIALENGETIYISKVSVPAISGLYVDYETASLGQQQLTYDNPNSEDLCGCGESFNLKPGIEAPGVKRYSGKVRG